jgi:tripartite-type tricarboxylate transporter receptor subunit TctC
MIELTREPTPRWRYATIASLFVCCVTTACRRDQSYPNRPITLICPWGAGGGTDRVSRQIAMHLEQELGQPVTVVNATGGKGVTGHSRGMQAMPDGYTLTMATFELSTMHWSGLTELSYKDCVPLVSVNEDYAALFVRAGAPWQNLEELQQSIRDQPKSLKASGTATGGAWHLALAGWLVDMGSSADDVTWISSTAAASSLQELVSGGVDMVCCSLPEARERLASGEIVAIGVMAPQRVQGFEDVPTFAEQGNGWELCGWRALVVPPETPAAIQGRLRTALSRIVEGETKVAGATFPQFMQQMGYDNTSRRGDELNSFLRETDQKFGTLLAHASMQSVQVEPFNRHLFPTILIVGMIITLGALLINQIAGDAPSTTRSARSLAQPIDLCRVFAFLLAVLSFVSLSPTIGFLASVIPAMALMCWSLGLQITRLVTLSLVLPTLVYFAFAHGLRVPLPRGWLDF